MGKEKSLIDGIKSYTHIFFSSLTAASLTLAAFAVGCAAGRPDHFVGLLQPQAGTCDPPSRAELILDGSHVSFTPREGIISLDGALAADGSLNATATSNGMDHAPYRQTFIGKLAGDRVTGTYTTPRCRYSANLSAPR